MKFAAGQVLSSEKTQWSMNAICRTRADMLDRLANILSNLGRVKLEIVRLAEAGDSAGYDIETWKAMQLRKDCHDIRFELEAHRAQHGC